MIVEKLLLRLSAMATLACHIACTGESDPAPTKSFTVGDSAGVEIVTSNRPLWRPGEEWRIEPEPFIELGELEGNEAEMFTSPVASLLSDGRILVTERRERELRLFAPDGQWIWTAGGEGEGPGEFTRPDPARLLPGDTILVFDRGSRRASWFAPTGEFIRSERIDYGDAVAVPRGVLDPETWLFEVRIVVPDSAGLNRWQSEVVLLGPDSELLALVDTLTTDLTLVESTPTSALFVPLPFFARPIITAGAGRAYISDNSAWEIRVIDRHGNLTRLIRREWEAEPVTDADTEEVLRRNRRWQEARTQTTDYKNRVLHMLEEGARLTSTKPALSSCFVDRVGNVWILDWQIPDWPAPERSFNVFDPAGVWLGPVTVPAGVSISDIGDDYVLTVVEDDLGIARVRGHRLTKPKSGDV